MALTSLALIVFLFAGYGSSASNHTSPTFLSQFTALDSSNQLQQHSAALSMPPSGQRIQSQEGCFTAGGYTPQQIAHAYGYDQFWRKGWLGQGMTVDLFEDESINPSDLQHFFDCVGYKGSVQYVNIGEPPQPDPKNSNYGLEATLDIELLAGLAPYVHIVDYQTDGTGQMNKALQQMITDHKNKLNSGDVVDISWGSTEGRISLANMQAIDQSLQTLTKQDHMTVFASSGDCGAFNSGTYGDLSVDYPASDPYAVAVGGTVLALKNGNRESEKVWSNGSNLSKCDNHWGSGGGLSKVFPQPLWQQGLGAKSNGARQLPDIAAVAENIPIYYSSLKDSGKWDSARWIKSGGTSASAPIWAAGIVLVNQALIAQKHAYYYGPALFYFAAKYAGRLNPYYDVTKGNNLYYEASSGWDYATGFGTPNLANLFNVLSGNVKNIIKYGHGMYKGTRILVLSWPNRAK